MYKKLNLKILLILFFFLLIFVGLFYFQKKDEVKIIPPEPEIEENYSSSNVMKNVKYVSKDAKGNEYTFWH